MGHFRFPAWDPVLLDLPGPLDVRWYGLMYIVGFVVGQVVLLRLARARFLPVAPERIADLIFWLVLGVILGGRIGYALFYDQKLLHPLEFVQVWQGGLSFHGGLCGVAVAVTLFARKHGAPFLRMWDGCALAVTPGIFCVRMANFINGELYGRETTAGTFGAMRFPTDPAATERLGLAAITDKRDQELAIQYAFRKLEWDDVAPRLSQTDAFGRPIPWQDIRPRLDWDKAQEAVPFRHPSQLYEGIGEGLVVGGLLWVVYRLTRKRPLGAGAYGGLFLCGYGVVRFLIEFLRQPDRQFTSANDPIGLPFFGLMTRGQSLCLGMVVAGLVLLWLARRRPVAETAAA
jgi:phosphatidylglycerol:prolipoprotein diacylglycerol transferase